MSDQGPSTIWDVPVTPAQRWELFRLIFRQGAPEVAPDKGKPFRRMLRGFGIDAIRTAARANRDAVSAVMAATDAPFLHRITAENADVLAEMLGDGPRGRGVEAVLGDLFDALEAAREGARDVAWASLPAYDPATENWAPPTPVPPAEPDAAEELVCPSCGQGLTYAEGKAHAVAAADRAKAQAVAGG